ncbi:MAG: TldD/PmbA family protein [Bacteroidales bacterium]|nr:TldD/PmbA family protein [Bacteroidales bacterium]MCL2132852.1 TldD/PmbA family protein [Bacteroidales bacterium]
MISQKHKELAQQMMEFARKNGCSASRIRIDAGTETTFEYRDEQLEKLQQASENRFSIDLFVDDRYGSYSSNRMEKKELEKFIQNAIESTRYLAADDCRTLPNSDLYYKGNDAPDTCFDKTIDNLQPDEKLQLAKATVEEVYKTDPHIISVSAGYSDSSNFNYLIDSNGFEGEKAQTYFGLSASISLKGDGDARPESWWYDASLFWNELQKTGIGKKALERALRKLGQEKIKSGNYTMVVDNMNAANLLSPIISALNGNSLQQKNSFLIDKIGKKIAAEKLTLIDDPHIPQAMGSRWYDYEGVATKKRAVIENGILRTYYIDTYNANKMKVEPTISGASILTFNQGTKDLDGLIGDVKKGILVTGFNGGNSNSSTGDFSFGIEGFLIENGQLVKPVSEMNITGNMLSLWEYLAAVGNDVRTTSSWRTPSLVFEKVAFSGL